MPVRPGLSEVVLIFLVIFFFTGLGAFMVRAVRGVPGGRQAETEREVSYLRRRLDELEKRLGGATPGEAPREKRRKP